MPRPTPTSPTHDGSENRGKDALRRSGRAAGIATARDARRRWSGSGTRATRGPPGTARAPAAQSTLPTTHASAPSVSVNVNNARWRRKMSSVASSSTIDPAAKSHGATLCHAGDRRDATEPADERAEMPQPRARSQRRARARSPLRRRRRSSAGRAATRCRGDRRNLPAEARESGEHTGEQPEESEGEQRDPVGGRMPPRTGAPACGSRSLPALMIVCAGSRTTRAREGALVPAEVLLARDPVIRSGVHGGSQTSRTSTRIGRAGDRLDGGSVPGRRSCPPSGRRPSSS